MCIERKCLKCRHRLSVFNNRQFGAGTPKKCKRPSSDRKRRRRRNIICLLNSKCQRLNGRKLTTVSQAYFSVFFKNQARKGWTLYACTQLHVTCKSIFAVDRNASQQQCAGRLQVRSRQSLEETIRAPGRKDAGQRESLQCTATLCRHNLHHLIAGNGDSVQAYSNAPPPSATRHSFRFKLKRFQTAERVRFLCAVCDKPGCKKTRHRCLLCRSHVRTGRKFRSHGKGEHFAGILAVGLVHKNVGDSFSTCRSSAAIAGILLPSCFTTDDGFMDKVHIKQRVRLILV